MYGYIRPLKSELKLREYEAFRAVYCGLCESLKQEYGLPARFAVNYDLTFYALLMGCRSDGVRKRCAAHPLRKRLCLCGDAVLRDAADFSVILGWWKLRDDYRDAGGIGVLPTGLLSLLMAPAFRKAQKRQPDFARAAEDCLRELAELESERSGSLDQTADCFARILTATVPGEDNNARVAKEVLYHVGRCIYLLDAVDDFKEDLRSASYNPLRCRFGTEELTGEQKDEIRALINLSLHRAAASLALRRPDDKSAILENIITLGIPNTTDLVFAGQWKTNKKNGSRL